MIEEKSLADKIEVLENGVIQVRTRFEITKDNTVVANSFTRKVIAPGDDFSQEDPKVKSICSVVHTPSVINDYKDFLKNIADKTEGSVE